jgi:hypothetical protein
MPTTIPQLLSITAFAQATGLRREAVEQRIRTGQLVAKPDNRGHYYIPLAELPRVRKEVVKACETRRVQVETLRSIEREMDEAIAESGKLVKEAAADLAKQNPGTSAWTGRLGTLRKAEEAHARALSMQEPYLKMARMVEQDGQDFLDLFDPGDTQESARKPAKKRGRANA